MYDNRDQEIKRVMTIDEDFLREFLRERTEDMQNVVKVITNTAEDNDKEERLATARKKAATGAGEAASQTSTMSDGTAEEAEEKEQGAKRFLSNGAREAVDGVLNDPDIKELKERLQSFAKERVLKAEAAARILKDEEGNEKPGDDEAIDREKTGAGDAHQDKAVIPGEGTDAKVATGDKLASGNGSGSGGGGAGMESETPILSGMIKDGKRFLLRRAGELQDAARDAREFAMKDGKSAEDSEKKSLGFEEKEPERAEHEKDEHKGRDLSGENKDGCAAIGGDDEVGPSSSSSKGHPS